jgi:hypothetical protein
MQQLYIDLAFNDGHTPIPYHLNDDYSRKFGAVFTPEKWANSLVAKYYYQRWIDGAIVLDPTAGNGVFIKAFFETAKERGVTLSEEMINRLYGIELNPLYVEDFYDSIKARYGIDFPKQNFLQGDIFFMQHEIQADLLIGNPPWVNFTDLADTYKEKIKSLFIYWGLVRNPKDLLLGSSRADIAALVISKVIHVNLKVNGEAIFFLPLSIFQNDGANQEFRTYNVRGTNFSVECIMDFNGEKIFESVLGRYGVAFFKRDKEQLFPIKYFIMSKGGWNEFKARPLFNSTDSLTVFSSSESEERLENFRKIPLPKKHKPRQGINTCGANDVYFISTFTILDENRVELVNKLGDKLIVNKKYVYPLAVSSTLTSEQPIPEKLVIMPYNENGKPLDLVALKEEEGLYSYLCKYRSVLESRKGLLIKTWIKQGFWWALMGVGAYCFADYKVMWKAFGDSIFSPRLLTPHSYFSTWQGNQSLNAYIGVSDLSYAHDLLHKLSDPIIQEYLSSMRMQGTCNWAQPGRIIKILDLF